MDEKELNGKLISHYKWIDGKEDGKRANFRGEDLEEVNFRNVDLRMAIFVNADLSGADLSGAILRGADMRGSDLSNANLKNVDFEEANFEGADMRGAEIKGATFSKAKNMDKIKNFPYPDLNILKSVKGMIRAYKLISAPDKECTNFKIGKIVEEKFFNSDEREYYGKGIKVATLKWCRDLKLRNDIILEVEFDPSDIAIPYATRGSFRVKRCKVLREIK